MDAAQVCCAICWRWTASRSRRSAIWYRTKWRTRRRLVTDAGQPSRGFSKGDTDFKNLTQLDLDIVYIATPWNWHVPMALDAMKNGKHAAVEVPACTTLQECWDLVNTSEATRKHCVILENCCYG